MISLRPYQAAAVEKVRAAFQSGKRAPLLVLPTGGGKTYCFSYITHGAAARGNSVMILTHRAELLDQSSRSLRNLGVSHGLIASGESMNQLETTQVASVQTLARRLERVIPPKLLVIDEAHHACAGTWKKVIDWLPKTSKILGVTATPERHSGEPLADIFDEMVVGPSVRELIAGGHLCQPRYFAPPVQFDASAMRTTAGDYNKHDAEAVVDKPKITGCCVEHYARICPGVPAVAFCCTIKHAEHVAEAFRAAGFRAATLDGTLSDFERRDRVASLSDGRLHVLTTVDVVSEGFDLPCITAAIFLRPTQSLGLFMQQGGRALRPMPGKQNAIILDHCANIARHGLLEEDREWSLGGHTEKREKKKKGDAGDRLVQCPKCYAVGVPSDSCACCGHVFVREGRKVDIVDGELVEIALPQFGTAMSGAAFKQCVRCQHVHSERLDVCPKCGRDHAAAEGRAKKAEQGSAQTFYDLLALGKKRGMKNAAGWAAHVFKARNGRMPTAEERGAIPSLAL